MEHHIYGRLTIFSACIGLFNYNDGGSGGLVVKWCLTLFFFNFILFLNFTILYWFFQILK